MPFHGARPFGLILAGGRASRMGGGDKALLTVGGRSILARIMEALSDQCDGLAVNASGDPMRWRPTSAQLLPDVLSDRPGPLAGVVTGLRHLADRGCSAQLLLTVPGDAPFLPHDLVRRLERARDSAGSATAMAESESRGHPVVALWPVSALPVLESALLQGRRSVAAAHAELGSATAAWPALPVDPFFNVNTPEDLVEADRLARLFES